MRETLLICCLRFAIVRPYRPLLKIDMDLNAYLEQTGRGAASRLAKQIGVTPVLISQWVTGSRPIPTERCTQIERATSGAVRCEELRPDLAEHWAYLRSTPAVSPREAA